MRGKIRQRTMAGALVLCISIPGVSFADCRSARAATASDISGGQASSLLKDMVAACKSQDAEKFFRLQTEDANKVMSSSSPAEKRKLFGQYCEFTSQAVSSLGGNLDSALHTVGPYKNRAKCGAPTSHWFVHGKSGQLALRLEVAVESGRLKIDTH